MRPTRILHTPTNVGNHPLSLSRAERELGFESDVVDFIPAHAFRYEVDRSYDLGNRPLYVHLARRGSFLVEAVRRYDVFHYNWGQPLLPVRVAGRAFNELALVKRLGKTVLVTFQGSDVRPRPGDRYQAPSAAAMLRHANRAFYLNPDLAPHVPGARFVPYASVDVRAVEPVAPPDGGEVVVGHAPSNRRIKGTEHVIAAVEALRGEGVPVRLDLIEGVPHAEALARLNAADLLVDQLLLGWYGGVAVEAMARARPVVAAIDESRNPFGDRLPIVRASAATLPDRLRELVADRDARRRAGAAARAFALAEHDPRAIARSILDGLVPVPQEDQRAM